MLEVRRTSKPQRRYLWSNPRMTPAGLRAVRIRSLTCRSHAWDVHRLDSLGRVRPLCYDPQKHDRVYGTLAEYRHLRRGQDEHFTFTKEALVLLARRITLSCTLATAIAATALLVSVSVPTVARAAETAHEKMHKMTPAEFGKMHPAECMKMMDQSHKGYVTKKEFLEFQGKLFDNIPKKAPDRVSEDEWLNQIHSGP